jgi:hypothetical protein
VVKQQRELLTACVVPVGRMCLHNMLITNNLCHFNRFLITVECYLIAFPLDT